MRLFFVLTVMLFTAKLPAQIHVFYLHGRIIELQGANAVETTNGYGAYKYNDILDSLKAKKFNVHSDVRSPDTQVNDYAAKINTQISDLLKQGVLAKNICIIGASKGAAIALEIARLAKNSQLKFVIMAACCDDVPENINGQVLSIYETSDNCGTCLKQVVAASKDSRVAEIALHTGLKHGFFYLPRKEWLEPAVNWAKYGN